MTLVLRWRVPARRVGLRWRGPAGLAEAIEREPLAPIAAVVGPPGAGGSVPFPPMAILADATEPVPAHGTGSAAWSTILAAPVIWDGSRWRSLAFFVAPAVEAPEWVPAGALVVSDFKNGLYWRQDIGVCELTDVWEGGDAYNGLWTPPTNITPGLGFTGSLVPQVVPEVFAMLDPVGDGFTAVLDGNVASGDDAGSDAYLVVILAEPTDTNEWMGGAIIRAPANPTSSTIHIGDYGMPKDALAVETPYYIGHHRAAVSIGYDGVAASLDGLGTNTRARADFPHALKPDPEDPAWRMLVVLPADHGNTLTYTEKVVFYPRVADAELEALSALAGSFDLDFTGGTLPPGVTFARSAGPATVFDETGTMQVISAADAPRFDHDPVTHVPRGLLIEPAATNLFAASADLTAMQGTDSASWSANAAPSPDGTTTADKLVESAADYRHIGFHSQAAVSGDPYTVSVFAKPAGRDHCALNQTDGNGATGYDAAFDLVAGTVGASFANGTSPTGTSAAIEVSGGGFQRVSLTKNAAYTSVYAIVELSNSASPGAYQFGCPRYAGDGSSGVHFWGLQIEAGPVATSYIPTTGATATRAADELTITVPAGKTMAHCTFDGGTADIAVSPGPATLTAADFGGPVRLQGIVFS